MKQVLIVSTALFLAGLSGCAETESGTEEAGGSNVIAANGTLTQYGKATTEAECPNGGVTLEHGIDNDADGKLTGDEISKTYVLCNGKDGGDAEVTKLKAEVEALKKELEGLTELKAAVEANTAKTGISDEQAKAIEANTAKVVITEEQAKAIEANTAKTTITEDQAKTIAQVDGNGLQLEKNAKQLQTILTANEEQAKAIAANTAKVVITEEQAKAIAANTAKVVITEEQAKAIEANTAKVGITDEQAKAIEANTAKTTITEDQAKTIAQVDGNGLQLEKNTKQLQTMLTANEEQAKAIEANTAKVTFPGFGTTAGTALEGNALAVLSDYVLGSELKDYAQKSDIPVIDLTPFACGAGYAGPACKYSDKVECSGNGVVQHDGSCICNAGWKGIDCIEEAPYAASYSFFDKTLYRYENGTFWPMKSAELPKEGNPSTYTYIGTIDGLEHHAIHYSGNHKRYIYTFDGEDFVPTDVVIQKGVDMAKYSYLGTLNGVAYHAPYFSSENKRKIMTYDGKKLVEAQGIEGVTDVIMKYLGNYRIFYRTDDLIYYAVYTKAGEAPVYYTFDGKAFKELSVKGDPASNVFAAGVMGVINGVAYIAAGKNFQTLYAFDGKAWTSLGPLPFNGMQRTLGVINNAIYFIGDAHIYEITSQGINKSPVAELPPPAKQQLESWRIVAHTGQDVVVALDGAFHRFDGKKWTVDEFFDAPPEALWSMSSENLVGNTPDAWHPPF